MTTVDFYVDPSCPWAWITSRWVKEVAPHRDLVVTWKSYCLEIRDDYDVAPWIPDNVREMALEPVVSDDARVRLRQAAGIADRPRQGDDEQQERDRRETAKASCESTERRQQRKQITVEVRAEGAEVDEVDERERSQDQIRPPAARDRDRKAEPADEQGRAEAVPEAHDEGNRRGVVVLEAEPALVSELLHAVGFAYRAGEVRHEEGTRRAEGDCREQQAEPEPAWLPVAGDREGDKQEDPRVLDARREPGDEPPELDPAAHEQGERCRDAEGQRDVRDRHA